MSTVAEIAAAIEKPPQAEVAKIAACLQEYLQMINASGERFAMCDAEQSEETRT